MAGEAAVVFVVQPPLADEASSGAGVLSFEPLAYLRDGRLEAIPENVDVQRFARNYYNPQQAYTVYVDGIKWDVLNPRGGLSEPCDNLLASARVRSGRTPGPSRMALASDATLREPSLLRRTPDMAEMAFVRRQIGRLFVQHGLPAALPATDQPDQVVVYEDTRASLLIATFSVAMRKLVGGEESTGLHAGFLIAERVGKAGYQVTRRWFHSGLESGVMRPVLVDIADLDGDGMPEIVLQNYYYEDYDFHVWHRRGAGWVDVYQHSGASCM